MAKYLNLDKLVGEETTVEIAGRKFDLTKVPARKMLDLLKLNQDMKGEGNNYEVFVTENTALIEVLGKDQNGEPATFEWIVDTLTSAQLLELIKFITEALTGEENFTAGVLDQTKN